MRQVRRASLFLKGAKKMTAGSAPQKQVRTEISSTMPPPQLLCRRLNPNLRIMGKMPQRHLVGVLVRVKAGCGQAC